MNKKYSNSRRITRSWRQGINSCKSGAFDGQNKSCRQSAFISKLRLTPGYFDATLIGASNLHFKKYF